MEYELYLELQSFIWNMEMISILLSSQSYCCFIRELVNPTVYSAVEQNRLAKAKLSDKTVLFVPKKKWLL
jgi:hypothetical protein